MAKIITLSDLRKREDELAANRARKARRDAKIELDDLRAQQWWAQRGRAVAEALFVAERAEQHCTESVERIRRRA